MPKSHVILASLLIAASAAAPSGVYIPSATSSNSVQNQNTNTQPQSQSRFKSIRAESPSEKPVVFGRPDKWGRYRTYDGKIRKSHKKRIHYWGVPPWDGINPLNALSNTWIYKRNHSPSRHLSRSPKFNKRSPMPVGDSEPLSLPLMSMPPLLPNGPNALTNPLDGLTPSVVANVNATVVDGGSGSVPLMGSNVEVTIGKRKRSYPDTPSQRVTETSHVESQQGLGLGVGLELGLGLGSYQEDDRTYSYEQDNPHGNTGNDNQVGNHPHARPAVPPTDNNPKPNHGDQDIHEDIHEHIHKHTHSSKRDDGAGVSGTRVPGTVDIVSMQNNTRIASLVLGIGSANGTSDGNSTQKVFVLNASETNRTTVYLVPDSNSSSTQYPSTRGSGDPSYANRTTPASLQMSVFDAGNAEMDAFCVTFDPTSQPSLLTLDHCDKDKNQTFEYWNESGVLKPVLKESNITTTAAPSNSTGGGMPDVELVFVPETPEVRPIEQDSSTSITATTTSVTTSSVAPSITATPVTASAVTSETPSSVATSSSIMSSTAASKAPAAAVIGFESASLESTSTVSDTSAMTGSVTSTLASTMTTTETNASIAAEDATPTNDAQADPTITPAPTMTTYNPDPNNTARTPITINESEANAAHESANRAHTHIRPNTYTLGPLQSFGNVENGYSASAHLPLGETTETAAHTSVSTSVASASTVAADGYSASAFVPLERTTKTVTRWHTTTSTETSETGTASAVSTVAEEGYSASAFVPLGRTTKTVNHWYTRTTPGETGTTSASVTAADVEATEMASSDTATSTGWRWWGSDSAAPSASASTTDQVNDAASSAPTNSVTVSDPDSAPYDDPAGASSTWDEWSAGSTAAAAENGPDSRPTTWIVSAAAASSSSRTVTAEDFTPNPGPWPTPSATAVVWPNPDFVDDSTSTVTKSGSTYVTSSTSDSSQAGIAVGDVRGGPNSWPSSSMSNSGWPSPSAPANIQANGAPSPTSTFTDADSAPTGVPPSGSDVDAEAMASMVTGDIEDNSAKDDSGTLWTRWIRKDKQ